MVSFAPQPVALMQIADGRQPTYRQESIVDLSKGGRLALLGLHTVSPATLAPTDFDIVLYDFVLLLVLHVALLERGCVPRTLSNLFARLENLFL